MVKFDVIDTRKLEKEKDDSDVKGPHEVCLTLSIGELTHVKFG